MESNNVEDFRGPCICSTVSEDLASMEQAVSVPIDQGRANNVSDLAIIS